MKVNGLIAVSIHNRSVDMLLKWINSQITTTSLYKRVKNKHLDNFVKRNREHNGALCYETSMLGVRNIFKALKNKKQFVLQLIKFLKEEWANI